MGRNVCKSVAYIFLLMLNVGLLLQRSSAQQSSFYFSQPQTRFVPSFESSRNSFFPSSIQRSQPPDSYQEQTLFVGSPGRRTNNIVDRSNVDPSEDGPLAARSGVTPTYFQFTYTRPSAAETGTRDRQLSYISQRARPFGSDDSPPSRGFPGSAPVPQRQRIPPSAARNGIRSKTEEPNTGNQHQESNNGSSSSSSGGRYRSTQRPSRYRSTTTVEPVTAKSTTVESVVLRNRFAGRPPAPTTFRQAFDSKRVPSYSTGTSARGTFINSIKSKSTSTTSTTSTTTTAKPPSHSRFIHLPARPVIPSINITHNGSAKSAEVIYDYDDYAEDAKDSNEFVDDNKEIKDFKPTSQKNNSISANEDEKKLVTSTTHSAPTSSTGKDYENEERGGSLNNINENEYYDVLQEGTGPSNAEKIEDHTVILTDNFYLPNGDAETFDDDSEEEGEEGEDYTEEPRKDIPSEASGQSDKKDTESAYDDEYLYDEEDPPISTTVKPDDQSEIQPAPAPELEDSKDDIDMLIFSEEDPRRQSGTVSSLEEVVAETTKAAPIETTSTTSKTPTTTTESTSQELSTTTERLANSSLETETTSNATTESWVVVASVQTSRSVSGARFLPFPQVEQEEKKQSLSELDSKNSNENDEPEATTPRIQDAEKSTISPQETVISLSDEAEITTTEKTVNAQLQSTESIIDKLDRVQSELSSGVLTGKFPVLKEMATEDVRLPGSTSLPPVVIRKFQPNGRATTTKKSKPVPAAPVKSNNATENIVKKINFDDIAVDDQLLPADYKHKKKFGTSSSTSAAASKDTLNEEPLKADLGGRFRPANISRSYKSNVPIQELSSLLPKDYRVNRTEEEVKTTNNLKELISKVKVNDKPNGTLDVLKKAQNVDVSSFLPPGFNAQAEIGPTTKAPKVVVLEDDVSKLLPPGYKTFKTTKKPTTTPSSSVVDDDIGKFLPPGYKPPKDEPKIVFDDVSKLLPPGYKPPKEESSTKPPIVFSEDISKFLPPGYKPSEEDKKPEPEIIDPTSLLSKIKFNDVSALVPKESSTESTTPSNAANSNFKVVFPSRPGIKKPGVGRPTTAKPVVAKGPGAPVITIHKGPPTRATTEFTGWPTPSTTPLSIEKLLEQQKQQEFLEKLLAASSTSTTSTTSTTTTTTTTMRPTEPGLCHSECDLAGTIRIVDGVKWVPELLDHNTAEWKQLARDVEAQLNEVYSKAQNLSTWYKKVRIDSFSKGSVLVDYFVELSDLTRDVNTLEIKKMFHDALTPAPMPTTTIEPSTDLEDEEDGENSQVQNSRMNENASAVPRVKEVFLLGRFKVDPVSTDFTVIPRQYHPTVAPDEEDLLLPQWAIAVIVIGLASLLFVILFGVTVLINRQKAAKKKAPTPLTADMLNELNKNHMGGIDNFGSEDLYNLDDAWEDNGHDVKPKRFSNSMHGSSASNIYDSWRSQRHPDNYYYDDYAMKGSQYAPSGHHRFHDAAFMMHEPPPPVMAMYPPYHQAPAPPNSHYNTNSRRYYRDYDPNF
ncbi:mucin-2 isoform X2 [Toxorhynchites rutilus septentrionalis]|uniref:mucin-2 isoform X2 n=1 Tax=Toxorhynchites rutilus septentrionalis TaxID=329112 RepID=UPI0024798983|nr:mucin-2 isoform X2 [Toxorhynchites rutilus septentrionalis]